MHLQVDRGVDPNHSTARSVVWTIDVNEGTSKQDILQGIEASGRDYEGIPGLVRTYFGMATDGKSVVEIYLWQSRADAETFFTHVWETEAARRWQSAPMRRQDFETPLVVEST